MPTAVPKKPRTRSAEQPTRLRPPLTKEDVQRMSADQLERLFSDGAAPDSLAGHFELVGLSVGPIRPGSLLAAGVGALARAAVVRGKVFAGGSDRIRTTFTPLGLGLLPGRTYVSPSSFDERQALFVDYRTSARLPVWDEIRQVAPRVYLGRNLFGVGGTTPGPWFLMWPSEHSHADYYRDKVALVTGGASGFGRALAEQLSFRGATVVVADIDEVKAKETAGAIVEMGGRAESAGVDVTSSDSVEELARGILRTHGRIDMLFNNAGVQVGGEYQDIDEAGQRRMVNINVEGVLHGIQAVYPSMIERGEGHIVNTASVAGLTPVPLGAVYSATKHFVVGLSTSLRAEAADRGVRVTVVCPGPMVTPFWDAPTIGYDKDKMLKTFAFRDQADPVECAKDTLDAVAADADVVVVGGASSKVAAVAHRLAPGPYRSAIRLAMRQFRRLRLDA